MKKILAFCLLLLIGSFVHGDSSPPQPILPEISPGFNPYHSADCFAQALPVVTPYRIGLVVIHSEAYPAPVLMEYCTIAPTSQEKLIYHPASDVNIQTALVQNPLKSDIGTNKIKPSNGGNLTCSILSTLYNSPLPAS
ncbi:MAG: hypothetical protein WCI92_19800 [Bacteroidota bacterium]